MTDLALKQQVLERISHIENDALLQHIMSLIDAKPVTADADIYSLSADEIAAIDHAREQVKMGHVLTQQEAQEDINIYLGQ